MEDEECLEYKVGKIYRLRAPSDGVSKKKIARYPVGLPVRFKSKTGNSFIVQEPHGGEVHFPLRPVWNQTGSIFVLGCQGTDPLLLEEFSSDKNAEYIWNLYANPDQNRWHVDDLREKMKSSIYSDWECGHSPGGIDNILTAARLLLTVGEHEPIYSQEVVNAICDISLLIYGGDDPGWCEEVDHGEAQEAAFHVVNTVMHLMDHNYFVKSGGNWDLKDEVFTLKDRR